MNIERDTIEWPMLTSFRPGIEAMGRMLCIRRDLPVILNTAYSCYKDDFRTWPAVAYVVKSSNMGELKSIIRRSLNIAA